MVTYFGSVLFSPPLPSGMSRNILSYTFMSLDRSNWPRCLLLHGWLPGLGGTSEKDPWASSFGDLAFGKLERCLGASPVDFSGSWTPPDYWDAEDTASDMPEHPNVWTDGSREDFPSLGVLRLLVLVFICLHLKLLLIARFGELLKSMVMLVLSVALLSCRFPGVMQTVQRAEFWVLLLPCRRTGFVIWY